MFPSLTEDVVFDPGEGDGALPAALAEAEQEGAGTLVAQQSLLPLFADEAHDGAAHGQKTLTNPAGTSNVQTSETNRKCRRGGSPVVPEGQQVSLNHVQDSFDPEPERERFLVGALRKHRKQRLA